MGRGEGPGCYCAVNHNLREVIDSMSRHYAYVVIDNEAGMEHLSRRDHARCPAPVDRQRPDPARPGCSADELQICARSSTLMSKMHSDPEPHPGEIPPELQEYVEKMSVPVLGTIPADEELSSFEFSGKPLVDLGDESPVYQAVEEDDEQDL